MQLEACTVCRRHVVMGTSCPFCGRAGVAIEARTSPAGRLSRAMVFASATLAATGACGGSKPKQQQQQEQQELEQERFQRHRPPCAIADPQRVAELEKARDDAKTDEEKAAIERDLQEARTPICAPYGAPPARRRVV